VRDARVLGGLLEDLLERVVVERAVVIAPAAVGFDEAVEQRRLWVAAPRVDLKPVGDIGLASGQRPLPAGALSTHGFLVERDGSGPAVEVDVFHAERADGADAEAGVE